MMAMSASNAPLVTSIRQNYSRLGLRGSLQEVIFLTLVVVAELLRQRAARKRREGGGLLKSQVSRSQL